MSNDPPGAGHIIAPGGGSGGGGTNTYKDPNLLHKHAVPTKKGKNKSKYVGNSIVPGSAELLIGYPSGTEYAAAAQYGRAKPIHDLTGDESLVAFGHMASDPAQVVQFTQIQSQLYRAGYYGTDLPNYGKVGDADYKAFRQFLIGHGHDPNRTPAKKYLEDAAINGDTTGVNVRKQSPKGPLVIKLKNDDDIRATIQAGAKELHNTYLSEDEIQKFIGGYHQQEIAAQTNIYNMGDPQSTGTLDGGLGGIQMQPADQNGIAEQVSREIRTKHETEFKSNTFTDRLDEMLAGLRGPGGSQQVGTNL